MVLDDVGHLGFVLRKTQTNHICSTASEKASNKCSVLAGVVNMQAATGSSEAAFSAKAVLHGRASVCSDSEPWGFGSVAKLGVSSHRTNRLPS